MIKPSFIEKTKFENLTENVPINFLLFLFGGTIRNESTVPGTLYQQELEVMHGNQLSCTVGFFFIGCFMNITRRPKKTINKIVETHIFSWFFLVFLVFLVVSYFIIYFPLSGFLDFLWFSLVFLVFMVFLVFAKKTFMFVVFFTG